MENPNFIPDMNGTLTDPELAVLADPIKTDIPLEECAEEITQIPGKKPKTGWRKESSARLSRELAPADNHSNLDTDDHRHRYILEDNLRDVSIGRCEGCGTEREFKNHIEDILGYTPNF